MDASDQNNLRQRITYTIFSGNENHVFSINRHTGGKLEVIKKLKAAVITLIIMY